MGRGLRIRSGGSGAQSAPAVELGACEQLNLPQAPLNLPQAASSEISVEDSPITPWSVDSGISVRPAVTELLGNIRRGAFQGSAEEFAALVQQAGGQGDLNRRELYAVSSTLLAAMQQRPGEYAHAAREAMIAVIENNSQHPGDLLLIAAQLLQNLSGPENAGLRNACSYILTGATADGSGMLNFSRVDSSGAFCTAAEGLRAAYANATPEMQELIRISTARLFEETHLPENNSWREFRVECAEVFRDTHNRGILGGASLGAARLQAGMEAINRPAMTAALPMGGPTVVDRGLEVYGLRGVDSGGPGAGLAALAAGGMARTTNSAPSLEERIQAIISDPALAREFLSNPDAGLIHTDGMQMTFLRFPGQAGVVPPLLVVPYDLSDTEIRQLFAAAGNPPAGAARPFDSLDQTQLGTLMIQLRDNELLREYPEEIVAAAIQLSQTQTHLPQSERVSLLNHLRESSALAERPDLILQLIEAAPFVPPHPQY